jgi:hypothetical protein
VLNFIGIAMMHATILCSTSTTAALLIAGLARHHRTHSSAFRHIGLYHLSHLSKDNKDAKDVKDSKDCSSLQFKVRNLSEMKLIFP